MSIVHETGHALGLKHGHEFPAISQNRDTVEYTVMTYRSYVGQAITGYANETWGFPTTPMMLDIAALQRMYGANFAFNSGDSVYSWSPTSGQSFVNGAGGPTPGGNRVFMTIWDGGGTDTYDLSNYGSGVTVDLRPGEWTTTSTTQLANLGDGRIARGNVANALLFEGDTRSLIENAIGGSGNDTLIANQATNDLTGGAGIDTFRWHSAENAGLGAQADEILDFLRGTDRIDLAAIDAITGTGANDSFTFIGTGAFTNVAGQLRYQVEGSNVRIQGDVDGNGIADMEIVVDNVTALDSTNFFF
jgi:serralysin